MNRDRFTSSGSGGNKARTSILVHCFETVNLPLYAVLVYLEFGCLVDLYCLVQFS